MYRKKNKVKKSSRHALARAFFALGFANWERKKRLASFDLLYLTAVRGRSYAEGAQRGSNAAPLRVPACGGVRFTPYSIGVAPVNRPVARFCISLSSGISMFARESETRGIRLKSVFLYRAELRIPTH